MKLKALDTIKITAVSREKLVAGVEFEASNDVGATLIARGLAVEVKPIVETKEAPKPKNKGKA